MTALVFLTTFPFRLMGTGARVLGEASRLTLVLGLVMALDLVMFGLARLGVRRGAKTGDGT